MPLKPTDPFVLEKSVWTDADFERMGWHDVRVHALAFDPERFELLLDIDYIFAWIDPEPPSGQFGFWIAPSTLVFHDVADFRADFGSQVGYLEINDLSRTEALTPNAFEQGAPPIASPRWMLDLGGSGQILSGVPFFGKLSFHASGFTQYTRTVPRHASQNSFPLGERYGVSFDRPEVPGP